jgi:hypothetical protein
MSCGERLDRMLVYDRGHTETVLRSCVRHFNTHRPHQGRGQLAPLEGIEVVKIPPRSPNRSPHA